MSVDSLYAISYTYNGIVKSVFIAKIDSHRMNIISNNSTDTMERNNKLIDMFKDELVIIYHDRDMCTYCGRSYDLKCSDYDNHFHNIKITAINKI